MNPETKNCVNCQKSFTIEPEDFAFYQSINVPPPTFCPPCRLQRRLTWRNERALYQRACGLCGKKVLTRYREGGPIISYCSPCWWSDQWDALSYGMEVDASKPFLQQFSELMQRVPLQNLKVMYQTLENSDYCNMNHALKNCYWLFNSDYCENCNFSEEVENSKDCVDVTMIDASQVIAHSVNLIKCYQTFYSEDCEGCNDVWFSKDLSNCSSCFGCINLRGKQYYIFNQPYSKEEYAQKIKGFNLGSWNSVQAMQTRVKNFRARYPRRFMVGKQNTEVTGGYISHSRKVKDSYNVTESENCRYCMWLILKNNKDCYDFTQFGENTQNVYEALVCGKNVANLLSCQGVLEGHDVSYSIDCQGSSNLFGCIGLRSKQYCILNKQYSPEEYAKTVETIKAHMHDVPYTDARGIQYKYGEFFPSELSPHAYNETSANEFFPLTAELAIQAGYQWLPVEQKNYAISIQSEDLPDTITDTPDTITNDIVGCAHAGTCNDRCSTAFRIIPRELEFYRTNNLPLPRLCPNCRHAERGAKRASLSLSNRACQCAGQTCTNGVYQNSAAHAHHGDGHCQNSFQTSYSPDRTEIVYCEQCYQQEVV